MTFTLVNKVEARTGHSFDSFSAEAEVLHGFGPCPYTGVTHKHKSRVLCGLELSFIFMSKHSSGFVGWNVIFLLVLAAVCQEFLPCWLVFVTQEEEILFEELLPSDWPVGYFTVILPEF